MEVPPPDLFTTDKEWAAYHALVDKIHAAQKERDTTAQDDALDNAVDRAFLTPYCLRRYLRARQFNVDKAAAMLLATIAWRRATRPDLLTTASVQAVYELGTVFLAGRDRHRRPVVYMRPGARNPHKPELRVQFMVWIMEMSIATTAETEGVEKITWVLDFSTFGERANDAESRETSKATLDILQNHYPERLGCAVLVNPPWYFRMLYMVISPFIDRVTREKVRIVSGDAAAVTAGLTELIAPEELLVAFGGQRSSPIGVVAAAAAAVTAS